MSIKAVIFDLDGVITDTADFHYQAWQRLADEEGLPFNREMNEHLRGVSRRDSLLHILDGRSETEARIQEMMARKNSYYVNMLTRITPADLLPGVSSLLDELDACGIPYAIASASKNAATVCQRLGIRNRLAALADGNSVQRQKPHPDLFRFAAVQLKVPPHQCLVVEDAAAGVQAGLLAAMFVLALGPADRFETVQKEYGRFPRMDDLSQATYDQLQQVAVDDPGWHVVQNNLTDNDQNHMETVFTIGNGYFATRGSFEEGHPGDSATTFLHGLYDDMPINFTGLVNAPNWLDMQIEVEGQPFALHRGTVRHFKRQLDIRSGILRRHIQWQAPGGQIVDLMFERFISYVHEHVGAIRLLATAVSDPCTIKVYAGINGHVSNKELLHWNLDEQGVDGHRVWLSAHTRFTKIGLTTAVALHSSASQPIACENCPGHPRLFVSQTLQPGQTLQLDKIAAYVTSRDEIDKSLVDEALHEVDGRFYDTLRAEQVAVWRTLWADGDVIIEGDVEAQLAVRFNLFQLLVAAPQHDQRVSIGAKALSGFGYFGHVFWDTEIFILPYLIYCFPQLAKNMLMYRYNTLEGARKKAAENGYEGAQFAWESATSGEEMTPTWVPHFDDKSRLVRIWTGDIQIHISADIAYAIMQYWQVTGDTSFMVDYGVEMILDTARFWGSRAELEEVDGKRQYAFRDVIGPDEYHDHVDNNSFTNYMARWHLQTAVSLIHWLQANHSAKAAQLLTDLHISDATIAHWQDIIDHIIFLFEPNSGLIYQFENFFDLKEVPPKVFENATQSLQMHFGIEGANQRQLLKQADVIMLLCLFRDQFDQKVWQTNWDTYMPITDHVYGSSLGPSFHAWAACEMNQPEEAYRHFMLAARADLRNPRGNAGDGIHAASAGGVWQAVVFGFAGLRLTEDKHTVTPRLPTHWRRLAFKFYRYGQQYAVDIDNGRITKS